MTPAEKAAVVEYRRLHEHPWHSPPHLDFVGQRQFFITPTCFEHQHHIGVRRERMTNYEVDLLRASEQSVVSIYAWRVLPNHYHVLVRTDNIEAQRHELGLLHGRSSYNWKSEDNQRERKVWFNCFDRVINAIFGRASIPSITIRCNTVTLTGGRRVQALACRWREISLPAGEKTAD